LWATGGGRDGKTKTVEPAKVLRAATASVCGIEDHGRSRPSRCGVAWSGADVAILAPQRAAHAAARTDFVVARAPRGALRFLRDRSRYH
jgi:hypothetical protein